MSQNELNKSSNYPKLSWDFKKSKYPDCMATLIFFLRGHQVKKGTFFMCFKKHILENVFWAKKMAIYYPLKMTTIFSFSFFKKINILNKLKLEFWVQPACHSVPTHSFYTIFLFINLVCTFSLFGVIKSFFCKFLKFLPNF